jgi:hypothetical protein
MALIHDQKNLENIQTIEEDVKIKKSTVTYHEPEINGVSERLYL